MATFSLSPALVGYYGGQHTTPATTTVTAFGLTSPYSSTNGSFLLNGALYFTDGASNVLANFGFNPTSGSWSDQGNFIDITNAAVITGNNSRTIGTYYGALTAGADVAFGVGSSTIMNGTVTSYNPQTGALVFNMPASYSSGSGYYLRPFGKQCRRSVDANGYVVFDQFPTVTPIANGTIDFLVLRDQNGTFSITMTVGDISSGADVEIADRTLTTAQPWSLSGNVKIRLPMSYTYSV